MKTEFKAQLQAYIDGQAPLSAVLQSLTETLDQAPELAFGYRSSLEVMAEQGVLDKTGFAALIERLEACVTTAECGVAEEATRVQSAEGEQTRLAPASRAAGDPDLTRVAPPLHDDDRTRLAVPLPPVDDDQTRIAPAPLQRDDDQTRFTPSVRAESTAPTSGSHTGTRTGARWGKPFDGGETGAPVGVGSVLKERFRLLEFIGGGGMGDVYKAEDSRRVDADDADPLVAVKVLNKTFREHPESLRALQREARKSQNLAHPNIINVFDFDRDRHNVFMTMELMKGEPLNEAIRKQPQGFVLDEVMGYSRGMAEALKYAHHLGVIHSDFKPSNVFVHQGVIKVFDFGIARAAKSGQEDGDTFDAGELGALTPAYASPEMLDGRSWGPDPRDDIYALGCIVYELLTGKHPFYREGRKIPANEAREQGLRPARIKALGRRQWNALVRTLAFEREARTPTVEAFIEAFLPSPSPARINRWLLWPGAAALLVGAAYIPLRDAWQGRQVSEFAATLAAGDTPRIEAQLVGIERLDRVDRDRYYSDVRIKEALTNYFIQRIEAQAAADRFDRAGALIEQAGRIYVDSRRIAEQAEQVRKLRAQRLNALNGELNALLDGDAAFAENYIQLQPLLESIARVDPASLMLKDPRAVVKYTEAARELRRQGALEQARAMLAVARQQFPGAQTLAQLNGQVERELQHQRQRQRIAELQQAVAAWNATPLQLETARNELEDLAALVELDGLNPEARRARQRLTEALKAAMQPDLAAYDWAGARQRLEAFEAVLDPLAKAGLQRSVAEAEAGHRDAQYTLARAVAGAAWQGRLESSEDSARAHLERLEQMQSGPALLTLARERLAAGYLRQARIARTEQRWQDAGAALDTGRVLAGEGDLARAFEHEHSLIAQKRTPSADTASLFEELQGITGAPAWSSAAGARALALLDRIESADPRAGYLEEGRSLLARRLQGEIATRLTLGRLDDARALAEEAGLLLPESVLLGEQLAAVEKAWQHRQRQQQDDGVLVLKQALLAEVDSKALTPAWEARLRRQIAEYEKVADEREFIASLRQRVAQDYLDRARDLRLESQFDDAAAALASAQGFNPRLIGLDGETQALQQARQRFEAEQALMREQALVASLQQSFTTQIAANDVRQASRTLAELAQKLPANDPFLRQQVPEGFAEAYLRLAEQQAKRGRYQDASQLIAAGLKYAPASGRLIERQGQYDRQLRIQRFTEAAGEVTSDNLQSLYRALVGLQTEVTGARYQQLQQTLQDGLLARIQAFEQTDFASAQRLLDQARQLFPDANAYRSYVLDPAVAERAAAIRQLKAQISGQTLAETLAMTPQVQQLQRTLPTADYQALVEHTVQRTVALLQAETARDSAAAASLLTQALALWPDQAAIQALKPVPAAAASAPRPAPARSGGGRPCTPNLAGYGAQSRAVCYDMLDPQRRAPYMVVLPRQGERQLAVSKFEVSVGDFNHYCVLSGECQPLGLDEQQPVTGLTRAQIGDYTRWLSRSTGSTYRLPSQEEWLYAAEAGGSAQPQDFNCRLTQGDAVLKGLSLVDVKAGRANGWGLVNYLGNAQELVTQGERLLAAGGHHQDKMSDCSIRLSRNLAPATDALTGFRLVKEI